MKKVINVDVMRNSDAKTIELVGSKKLMYEAGKSIYEAYDYNGKVAIICGSGNNAGDGYVLASFLPDALVIRTSDRISDDSKYFYDKLNNKIEFYNSNMDFNNFDIIVDCIFGTGFNKEINDYYKEIIDKINSSNAYIISADINSGLNGNNGIAKVAVKSDLTISIGYLKVGHFINDAKDYVGKLINNNIGIGLYGDYYNLIEEEDVKKLLSKRKENSNKKTFGYTAIIAGSKEYSGAAKLSTLAYSALRMGSGIAKLYTAKSLEAAVLPYMLESIFVGVDDVEGKMIFTDEFKKLSNMDSIAIGMGLGESLEYEKIIEYIIKNYNCPIIIDADGINTLSKMDLSILKKNIILTPHLKEFSRLTGYTIPDIRSNMVAYATDFAKKYNCILLLKGPSTIVTDGDITYIVNRGSSGMATAGSGDVLSGVLAGITGWSKEDLLFTVACGAYINGYAGELGAEDKTEISALARDTIINIPAALKKIRES